MLSVVFTSSLKINTPVHSPTYLPLISFMPDLRLTNEEDILVNREGCVLVLGRSGTGKTSCTAMRIAADLKSGAFRQLFVARSSRLCRNIKRIVVSECWASIATSMYIGLGPVCLPQYRTDRGECTVGLELIPIIFSTF